MASLRDMRSDVVSGMTEIRPGMDFPAPDKLIDFWIATAATKVLYEKARRSRSHVRMEPWMTTRFECLSAALDTPLCQGDCAEANYKIDLPFTPLDLPDEAAFSGIWIQNSMAPITMHNGANLARLKYLRYKKPSRRHPGAYRIGNTLYLTSGSDDRDFTKASILIDVAVIEVDNDVSGTVICSQDVNIPISNDLVYDVVNLCVQKGLAYLRSGEQDLVAEGNQISQS